jgi:hypothetical protein
MIFSPLMLCVAEAVSLLAPFDPDPARGYKGPMKCVRLAAGLASREEFEWTTIRSRDNAFVAL